MTIGLGASCPGRLRAILRPVAQTDAKGAFNILFLGLGPVALLVGAIGAANMLPA